VQAPAADPAIQHPGLVLGFPEFGDSARRVARRAGMKHADIDVHRFPDGESLVRLPERLPPDVVLFSSLDDANRRLIELELAAAAALELGARRLTLVAPYLCYMRQDIAFRPGEAVSQRIIGAMLARHFDTLITVDPHLHRTARLEDAVPVRQAIALSAAPLIADWLERQSRRPFLVGPDAESQQWVSAIAGPNGLEYAIATKQRRGDSDVSISLPEVDFGGRDIVLVDDVASTGRTLSGAASQLLSVGARTVSVVVTHALFAGNAYAELQATGVTCICSTNSIAHQSNRISLDALLGDTLAKFRP
jgi:ribose-phosphate pyrophosphokinase